MKFSTISAALTVAFASLTTAAPVNVTFTEESLVKRGGGGISVTPHAQYSSSVGVLGCKIDTNRV
jgi:hypothetical protein